MKKSTKKSMADISNFCYLVDLIKKKQGSPPGAGHPGPKSTCLSIDDGWRHPTNGTNFSLTKDPTYRVWVWNAWDVVNGRSYTSVLMFMAVVLSWFLFLSVFFLVLKKIGGWFFWGTFGEGNSAQIDLNLGMNSKLVRFIWVVVEFKKVMNLKSHSATAE